VPLPKDLPVQVGAILDPLVNAVHTVMKTDVKDRTVAIIGYGPIGAFCGEVATFVGASHIFVVDVADQALARPTRQCSPTRIWAVWLSPCARSTANGSSTTPTPGPSRCPPATKSATAPTPLISPKQDESLMPNLSIELLKPHTHAGKRLSVGDRLDLNDASARWLITQGTAKAATPATDSKPTRRDATSGVSTTAATQGD